ncbi:MAG: hypothetical protein WBI12_00070 [Methanosarcina flavescens]|jgi:hypothetical protein|uniref:Uncharacterized protein n=1 Tax=Methanosarcina flavescens TaxID=1715806 RepID=A0A660HPG5_9EURY|nr:hypothetical protein [Methanosarcina flavescens]AYK14160.1 hypothetical protein AOB57_002185 [Methanosarcina flavescens]NLK33137.1 hypothetical protein [Methanosarcina flavescens]
MSFKEIKFGFAAAEKEKSDSPQLLMQGFFDAYGYISEIIGMNKFLILGPKGSGKSAIGARLELLSDSNKMFFTKQYYLTSFPYKPFSSIALSSEAPETKLPINWEFILLIASLNSFIEDPTCKYHRNHKIDAVINALKNEGILPSEDLAQIVKISSNKQFMVNLKSIISGQKSSQSEKVPFNIEKLFATLQSLCYSLQMKFMHYIIIDGLDDALTQRSIQYQSLSALILAADRMNDKFKTNKVNARIIVLCRTDIFDKLGGPNKNKVRRDSGILLDWFQDVNDLKSTNIIKLVNLRAELSLGRKIDIF